MNKFDPGEAYCKACDKYVIKPCFFLLETSECLRLQDAIENAKQRKDDAEPADS